jgi:hypothetical protein
MERIVSEADGEYCPGVGIATAMMHAVSAGDIRQLDIIHHEFGTQFITDSVIELVERMMAVAGIIYDDESLESLHMFVHETRVFHQLPLRFIDKISPYMPAVLSARDFLCELIDHHLTELDDEYCEEDDCDDCDDCEYAGTYSSCVMEFVPSLWTSERSWVIGLAYSAALIATELATLNDLDLDVMIGGYRRVAAQEFAQTVV